MRSLKIAATALLLVTGLATVAYALVSFTKVTIYATDGNLSAASALATGSTTSPIHGGLFVQFKEAGLGNNAGTSYLVTADASAVYGCINGGSNHPKANNKEEVSGPVSAPATFSSDNNGTVQGAIAVAPLPAGAFSCPGGQSLALISVSYTNVVLTDVTNGVSQTFPGPYSLSFY